jgi:hypothetical protein
MMEVRGIPNMELIALSRKKDHYFDTDGSPFLIEDPDLGILRIPDARPLEVAVPTQDRQLIDFMAKCLELDPR